MVEALIAEQNLSGLSNDREDPWLIIVIPIRSDTQVDFLGEIIGLVRRCELEDAVWGCKRDILPKFC